MKINLHAQVVQILHQFNFAGPLLVVNVSMFARGGVDIGER